MILLIHSNTNSTWAISKVAGTLSFLSVFVELHGFFGSPLAVIAGYRRCQGRKSAPNGSWISLPRATSMPPRSLRKARRGAAWIEFWHGASHKMVLEAETANSVDWIGGIDGTFRISCMDLRPLEMRSIASCQLFSRIWAGIVFYMIFICFFLITFPVSDHQKAPVLARKTGAVEYDDLHGKTVEAR